VLQKSVDPTVIHDKAAFGGMAGQRAIGARHPAIGMGGFEQRKIPGDSGIRMPWSARAL
jgi:hypothetical protein